ncbi:hypothetical protein GWK47_020909 [Chionoecetes opilio]|uniref:Uncharacterized protein n=1 Tax=Chionoecetes opilio TaxID=41210 RepID=A0A8J4XPT9_CHIOP|nr:hypothetical protein GWK47_020909 [Chionoecetes opilio]
MRMNHWMTWRRVCGCRAFRGPNKLLLRVLLLSLPPLPPLPPPLLLLLPTTITTTAVMVPSSADPSCRPMAPATRDLSQDPIFPHGPGQDSISTDVSLQLRLPAHPAPPGAHHQGILTTQPGHQRRASSGQQVTFRGLAEDPNDLTGVRVMVQGNVGASE